MPEMPKMRVVCLVATLGGCSLLYDPDNLPGDAQPSPDTGAMIDAHAPVDQPTTIDANGLVLETVGPHVLLEGQGTGGSRPAILAITGRNIAPDAVVTVIVTGTTAGDAPMIELDNAYAARSPHGTSIAVAVTLPVDVGRGDGEIALTVQVTQAGSAGPISAQLEGVVTLHTLPELEAAPSDPATLVLYSRVALTAPLSFAPQAGRAPVVIRAVSSIALADVHVDANKNVPGPGGNAGGAKGVAGAGPGGGRPAALLGAGLVTPASGGGYATAGGAGLPVLGNPNPGGVAAGDELLILPNNRSSGGGGGGVQPGGGGGGSLELTAGGTLDVGAITANGGIGGADGLLSGAGGGGTGGTILLRAGSTATIGKVTANGGAGGDHRNTGQAIAGAGAGGRLRYDVAMLTGTPELPPASRAGVSFSRADSDNPLITGDAQQGIVVAASLGAANVFDVYVFNADGATTASSSVTFAAPAQQVTPGLSPGYNRICLTPDGRNPLVDPTLTSCLDMAYVP